MVDLPEMAAWEPHTDPLLADYNMSCKSADDWRDWLQLRLQHRWCYGIHNLNDGLVGHISLRELDPPRSSRLGITIAAQYVNQRYGHDALGAFLDYYFGRLGFQELRLDVSGANLRARRVYQDLGFEQVESSWRLASPTERWGLVRDRARLRHFHRGRVRFFEMRLLAAEWRRVRATLA